MKYTQKPGSSHQTVTPETPTELAALEYLNNHRPFFAVAEQYTVNAFIAGVEHATKQHAATVAAAKVIGFTAETRAWLEANDPQALKQLDAALANLDSANLEILMRLADLAKEKAVQS